MYNNIVRNEWCSHPFFSVSIPVVVVVLHSHRMDWKFTETDHHYVICIHCDDGPALSMNFAILISFGESPSQL